MQKIRDPHSKAIIFKEDPEEIAVKKLIKKVSKLEERLRTIEDILLRLDTDSKEEESSN